MAQHLAILIAGSPKVMQVLYAVRGLGLPDWRLFSGAVYQTVWNALTERDADHGIKDYDIGYFDPDTSWEAEDAVIRRVARRLRPALGSDGGGAQPGPCAPVVCGQVRRVLSGPVADG